MSNKISQQLTTNNQQQNAKNALLGKVKKFPLTPGVYQFIGSAGKILYVGRATKLRQRVSQYFQNADLCRLKRGLTQITRDPRIVEMVNLAKDIKYIQTDSVLEAIILEANLIKKYWPKYNVKDKDDRSFIYIVIPKERKTARKETPQKDAEDKRWSWRQKVNFDYPAPIVIRGRQLSTLNFSSSAFYVFGPYQSQTLVNNALRIIRRIFPYSTCVPGQGKPCFNYQIGLCPGACVGAISKIDYKKNIKDIVLLLKGDKKRLLEKMKKENPEKIKSLKHIQDVSLMTNDRRQTAEYKNFRIEGYDISHLSGKETYGSMVVFENYEPNKDEYRLFKIKGAPASDDLKALGEVVERRFKHKEWRFPDLIMIDGGIPQIRHISRILREQNIHVPIVGISKYGGDKLVFPLGVKKETLDLTERIRNILLKVRDEAHRFALKSSRKKRLLKL